MRLESCGWKKEGSQDLVVEVEADAALAASVADAGGVSVCMCFF